MKHILLALVLLFGVSCDNLRDQDGDKAYDRGDYATAFANYTKAASVGQVHAQHMLGVMYWDGDGVPQDAAQAVHWFRKAAKAGDTDAQYKLGQMYEHGEGAPQNFVQAHRWFNIVAAYAPDIARRAEARAKRDDIATMMSPRQIVKAQKLAREWKPTTSTKPVR